MKTRETRIIEHVLLKSCFGANPQLAKEYGTTEVTIDFQRNGNGHELVDFMSYDPRMNLFKCYEIKVSMKDFKSKAKKSWYGNLNYLVIPDSLFKMQSLDDWKHQIPDNVGIIVINIEAANKSVVKKSTMTGINAYQQNMLKNSLLRTLFYQNQKSDWYLRNKPTSQTTPTPSEF